MTQHCEDFEKLMVLESELSNTEKETLTRHLATCESCRARYALQHEAAGLISKVAGKVMTPPDYLSGRIMEQIQAGRRETFSGWLARLVESRNVELSLATVCTMLLVAFAVELAGPVMKSASPDFPESKGAIQIDSRLFRDALTKYRIKQPVASSNGCLSPLKSNTGYLDCLKSKRK